jgi:hypothetical protein
MVANVGKNDDNAVIETRYNHVFIATISCVGFMDGPSCSLQPIPIIIHRSQIHSIGGYLEKKIRSQCAGHISLLPGCCDATY